MLPNLMQGVRAGLSVLLTAMAVAVGAAPVDVSLAHYRGSDEVLLTVKEGGLDGADREVTERAFFLFSILDAGPTPSVISNWKEASPIQKQNFLEGLERYLMLRFLADEFPESLNRDEFLFLQRAQRIIAGPAAQWVWADTRVRRSVVIFPEDLVYHYRSKPEEFAPPRFSRIRRLLVPIAEPMTLTTQNAAIQRAAELREEAQRGGGLAPILERDRELSVDPPGTFVELTVKSTEQNPEVLQAAFELPVNGISDPIRTQRGIMLVEVLERSDADVSEEATLANPRTREKIRLSLRRRFLPQQFDYLLGQITESAYATNHARLFTTIPGDADIARVRDFRLTRDELYRLYGDRIGNVRQPNRRVVAELVKAILDGEVVTQDLEQFGLIDEAFTNEALELADVIYRAREVLRQARQRLEPTESQVELFLEENQERILPGEARVVWKFEVFLRDAERIDAGIKTSKRFQMQRSINQSIAEASRQLEERRQLTGRAGLSDPEPVVRKLPQPTDIDIRTRFVRVGTYNKLTAVKELGIPFGDLLLGRFTTPVFTDEDTLTSFYVSEEIVPPPPPRAEQLALARTLLIEDLATQNARARLQAHKDAGDFVYHPLVLVAEPGTPK